MAARRKVELVRERTRHSSARMPRTGTVVAIGGHEDRVGDKHILRAVADRLGQGGKIVVCTVASEEPHALWEEYESAFRSLDVPHVHRLDIESREDASSPSALRILDGATGVFFTGGDQLRITSQIGDTPTVARVREIYARGGVVAGTSAGASVMSETMLVANGTDSSDPVKPPLLLAPGLGFASDMLIDQHFSERGRMARLIGAISQHPRVLGVGIDEDTALILEQERHFRVLGAGGVYVVDASSATRSTIGEARAERGSSTFGIRVHMLSQGDRFDLSTRTPSSHSAESMERYEAEMKQEAAGK
jgi:cyanophycinase